eukprot:182749_1
MDIDFLNIDDIDDLLDEIDETEKIDKIKQHWIIGSRCEVYSRSTKAWLKGKVTNIFNDDEGEWLEVKYTNNTKIKEIQRYSQYIRPIYTNWDEKQNDNNLQAIGSDEIDWKQILKAIRDGNIYFITNLITSNEININEQNPENGKTLLIYSVIIGNVDLVKIMCNFGSNVYIKDDQDKTALDYAMIYGQRRITELVYYHSLSGSLGTELKNIATKIHERDKQAETIMKLQPELAKQIKWFIIEHIEKRIPFSEDLLYYAWYFELKDCEKAFGKNPLKTDLWKRMMRLYENILQNTEEKEKWDWLKKYFLSSLVWFRPHPKQDTMYADDDNNGNDDGDNRDRILKKTLFWE